MSLRSARPVSELSSGAAITPAQTASDDILQALRAEGENDEAFQMDRFAVVWARLVKTAPPEQLEGMACVQSRVGHAIDDGHSARADSFVDSVALDLCARGQLHGLSLAVCPQLVDVESASFCR